MANPSRHPALKVLLDQLCNVKRTGNGWRADCPLCDDTRAMMSASLCNSDQGLILNCFGKCRQEDILKKLGFHVPEGGDE